MIRALLAITMGVVVAFAAVAYRHANNRLPHSLVAVETDSGLVRFTVEVATTQQQQARGLMLRKSLAPDAGMLFDFKTARRVAFWMKDTLIPLDMIFISGNGRIVQVFANAQPLSEKNIPSHVPVRAVLEIVGGRAAQLGIKPGDRVLNAIFADAPN